MSKIASLVISVRRISPDYISFLTNIGLLMSAALA